MIAMQPTDPWQLPKIRNEDLADGLPPEVSRAIHALYSWEWWKQERAVIMLARLGESAVLPLLGVLQDPDPGVRTRAARALGKLGDVRAIPPLIELFNDPYDPVREVAAKALSQMGEPAVLPLIAALKHEYSGMRWFAAQSLGLLNDTRAVLPLIEALRDRNVDVGPSVAQALGMLGDVRAVLPLIDALNTCSDYDRSAYTQALTWLGTGTPLPLRVLASVALSPAEKWEILQTIRNVRFKHESLVVRYPTLFRPDSLLVRNPLLYCQRLLESKDTDAAVKTGASAVLAELQRRAEADTLLRPGERDSSQEKEQLLRAAKSEAASLAAEEHLRPAQAPPQEKQRQPGWLARLLKRT